MCPGSNLQGLCACCLQHLGEVDRTEHFFDSLPLSHFHKAKVQIQPKWAFVALGPQALLQPKSAVLEIPMHMLFWRLAVSFAGRLSCWKICCLALHLSLLSPVPYAAGLD